MSLLRHPLRKAITRHSCIGICIQAFLLTSAPTLLDAGDPNYYDYYPGSVMSLGVGITPEDLTAAKVKCIQAKPIPLDKGALRTLFYLYAVTNDEQMKQAIKLDARVDASYLVAKAEAHYGFSQQKSYAESDLVLIVTAESEFTRLGLDPPIALTPEADALLKTGNLAAFDRQCGSRLVIVERQGSRVTAMITITGIRADVRAAIVAGAMVGGSFGPLSASAQLQAEKELQHATTEKRIHVDVGSTGGEGFGKLAGLVTALSANGFEAIEKSLGDYLGTFTKENAAPIGFAIGEMPGRGVAPMDLWNDDKMSRINTIINEYRASRAIDLEIEAVLRKDDPRADLFSDGQLDKLRTTKAQLDHYLSDLASVHRSCLGAKADRPELCSSKSSSPVMPAFFEPITTYPTVDYQVVVDGVLLNPLVSKAILGDPGGGTVLERARLRKPTAKAATTVMVVRDTYLLDVSIWVGVPLIGSIDAKVFYPGGTAGSRSISGPSPPFALAIGVDRADTSSVDVSRSLLGRYAAAFASEFYTRTGVTTIAGKGYYIGLSCRDAFGSHPLLAGLYELEWVGSGSSVDITLTQTDSNRAIPTFRTKEVFERLSFSEYLKKFSTTSGTVGLLSVIQ